MNLPLPARIANTVLSCVLLVSCGNSSGSSPSDAAVTPVLAATETLDGIYAGVWSDGDEEQGVTLQLEESHGELQGVLLNPSCLPLVATRGQENVTLDLVDTNHTRISLRRTGTDLSGSWTAGKSRGVVSFAFLGAHTGYGCLDVELE